MSNNQAILTRNDRIIAAEGKSASTILRNTYLLLAMTLIVAATTATFSALLSLPYPGLLVTLGGYFGLLFLTSRLSNSNWGIAAVFALTGFMGYTLGPIVNAYLSLPSGPTVVAVSLAATGITFIGLSVYARSAGAINALKLGPVLLTGILVAFVMGLAAILFSLPALSLAVSAMFVLLMSGLIVYQTQSIVAGGEDNYIMATVTLFVSLYNLFASLMHLLGMGFGGDD